jgi:hypothetical protein
VVYDNSNVVVANNELTTKNQIKEKNKVENKKSLPPIIKPQKIYEKMVEHGDVEADDMMVKYRQHYWIILKQRPEYCF